MIYSKNFKQETLKLPEEGYKEIKITNEQLRIINILSSALLEFVHIPEIKMKSILWYVICEWQIRNNICILDIYSMPIGKQLDIVKEIFRNVKKKLINMLNEPKKDNELLLDVAVERAFKLFLEDA
jgi:hypothetical protein